MSRKAGREGVPGLRQTQSSVLSCRPRRMAMALEFLIIASKKHISQRSSTLSWLRPSISATMLQPPASLPYGGILIPSPGVR